MQGLVIEHADGHLVHRNDSGCAGLVEQQRHLAEDIARAHRGQGFFLAANSPEGATASLEDQEGRVPNISFADDGFSGRIDFLGQVESTAQELAQILL